MKITVIDYDKVMDKLAEELAQEIDFGVLADALVLSGWTKIVLPYFDSRYHSIDVENWAIENCSKFKHHATTYVFESGNDATAFALKWL